MDEGSSIAEELELLQAVYSAAGELTVTSSGESTTVRINIPIVDASKAWDECDAADFNTDKKGWRQTQSFELVRDMVADEWAAACQKPISIHFKLPPGYPDKASCKASVDHPSMVGLYREHASHLVAAVSQAPEMAGRACVTEVCPVARTIALRGIALSLLQSFHYRSGAQGSFFDWLESRLSAAAGGDDPEEATESGAPARGRAGRRRRKREERKAAARRAAAPKAGLRVIWFHHIRSPTKRKNIQDWAAELGLRGISKIGYPGVVVVDGEDSRCDEYISRLRALRWKAMALRAQETYGAQAGGRDGGAAAAAAAAAASKADTCGGVASAAPADKGTSGAPSSTGVPAAATTQASHASAASPAASLAASSGPSSTGAGAGGSRRPLAEPPTATLESLRVFGPEVGFREVSDAEGGGMGAVADLLKSVGKEGLFRTAVLKMPAKDSYAAPGPGPGEAAGGASSAGGEHTREGK